MLIEKNEIISFFENEWSLLLKMHYYHLRMLFAMIVLIGSKEEDFSISSMYIHHFVFIFLWKKARLFIWTSLKTLHQWMLWFYHGWNEIFQFINLIFAIPFLSPFRKGCGPSFENKNSPTRKCVVASLVTIDSSVLEKKIVFSIRQCNFAISLLSPLRKSLNSHYLRILCANFVVNGVRRVCW